MVFRKSRNTLKQINSYADRHIQMDAERDTHTTISGRTHRSGRMLLLFLGLFVLSHFLIGAFWKRNNSRHSNIPR